VFAVQDEITRRVVAVIEPEIERAELKKAAAKRPENLDVWDYYLRGMAHLHQMTKEGNASAREMFRRAIALDPDYGDAYARLSLSFERDLLLEVADDRARAIEQALETAKRAVALDDASAHAHQALSTAYLWANQYDLALAQMNKAVSLNPYDGDAHLALGNRLDLVGRSEEGVREMEAAFQLYPTHPRPHMYMCFLARAYIGLRRYDLAEAWARRALEGRPDYPHAHFILALCLGHLGRLSEARAAVAECERLHPGFADKRRDWRPYLDPARNAHLLAGLRRIDQVE
jgi:adenylate cyclase